jgi:Family of unknown function (DUF6056)
MPGSVAGRRILMSNSSMRNPSAIWWAVPVSALLLFYILNLVMPINADDFNHSVYIENGKPGMMTSFPQFMKSMQKEFLSYNSRLGQIYYRLCLTFLPRWFNSFIITLWLGGLIFLVLRIALRRKVQPSGFDMTLWLGILSVIFLPLQSVENFISYTSGLYNYIPGGVGTLLVLDRISRWFIEGEDNALPWWIYVVGFASGWSNEVYGFFMVPLFGILIFWSVFAQKEPLASVPSRIKYLMLSFTLGFIFLALAPGTQARSSSALMHAGNSLIASFVISAALYSRFALLAFPSFAGLVFLLLLYMRHDNPSLEREKLFFGLLLLSTTVIIFFASLGGFIPYGRALWGVYLVLGIILVWGASHLMQNRIWLATAPVMLGALTLFGVLIWNTYIVRTEFDRIAHVFLEAGKRGEKVVLVDFPALRKEPQSSIMRDINRVVLVQRDPKHWLNTGLVRYYNALYADREGFKGPSYIILNSLVPPYLDRYAFDTSNDPLSKYPEILSLIRQQEKRI